ncbi:THUMP domain-containing class I SAM-dependent RNA methyltransferase [Halocynthiibacter namhaensis]|uniref:THUMP domain-containing class I SAM-dependent RNA methyltransferase n=1 Tax=Halocynthiibacter namhaensis TaxID=1290553 RepID=UPI0005792746|nr:RNA methyltransferase [Halocynthiibacter namhaensis]
MDTNFEIFLSIAPGLEAVLLAETQAAGFENPKITPGGVTCTGDWGEVWRANLTLRTATRVLARIGEFRAFHLAQLDKRSRKFPWADVLRADHPIRVEVSTNKKSKIYHAGAAKQRVETAIKETLGAEISADADICLKLRIDDNNCVFSVDTTGESLHKRGHKVAVNKAPMRETLASGFLYEMGYDGSQAVLDPMCGSGTFILEAAEISAKLLPGRSRSFAFEKLATFDANVWQKMRSQPASQAQLQFFGSDRDQGAVRMSQQNAERAGISDATLFQTGPVSDLQRPDCAPGIVIVNPPYGARIGNKKLLFGLYGALGKVLLERFSGWRVGIITTDAGLARATGLKFKSEGKPIPNGGLKIRLFETGKLP